jgi:hypothetical protein
MLDIFKDSTPPRAVVGSKMNLVSNSLHGSESVCDLFSLHTSVGNGAMSYSNLKTVACIHNILVICRKRLNEMSEPPYFTNCLCRNKDLSALSNGTMNFHVLIVF